MLGVRGPFGTDWDLDGISGGDVVMVAGGIGLALLRPAIHALLARPDRHGRILLSTIEFRPGQQMGVTSPQRG